MINLKNGKSLSVEPKLLGHLPNYHYVERKVLSAWRS
jgi:hypothetical protein